MRSAITRLIMPSCSCEISTPPPRNGARGLSRLVVATKGVRDRIKTRDAKFGDAAGG
jgi:hypothetical protein